MGGCVLMNEPMQSKAGGSGINTATHLRFLIHQYNPKYELELQTLFDPNDEHGQLLMNHLQTHNIPVVFCSSNDDIKHSNQSTPHVIVLVTPNERSFIAYLGSMNHFHANDIQETKFIDHPSHNNNSHHLHIHVAGYYNIPQFWNDQLKSKLMQIKQLRQNFKHTTTTISLTPQYDSLQLWDGQIISLLECIDFLILSHDEALSISKINLNTNENEMILLAQFFQNISSKICVIVTLGSKGAIALHNGTILHHQPSHKVENVVDATGAGDSFAAGFLFGFLQQTFEDDVDEDVNTDEDKDIDTDTNECCSDPSSLIDQVKEGMKWGCILGAACVQIQGASVPPTQLDMERFMC